MNVRDPKDFVIVVEPFKRGVKRIERVLSDHALVCNITKIKERSEGLGDVDGDIAFKSVYKDLVKFSMVRSS